MLTKILGSHYDTTKRSPTDLTKGYGSKQGGYSLSAGRLQG